MSPLGTTENVSTLGLRRRTTIWVTTVATTIFLLVWLAPQMPGHFIIQNYTPWHAIIETIAVAIAATIFAITWQAHVAEDSNNRLPILGAAFLAVALLDIAHMLSFHGMSDWVTPSGSGKGIYFWFFARYAAAVGLLFLVLPSPPRPKPRIPLSILILLALAYVTIACWLVLYHLQWLPVFIVPGMGLTALKVMLEWGIIFILLVILAITWRQRERATFYDHSALMLAIWLSILSELCFTLYSNVSGVFNVLGHLYKIAAYAFLYQGIVVAGVKLPYRLLAKNQSILQQLTENIRQVFWLSSADKQHIYYISPAYEQIWGHSCQSLIDAPSSWLDAIHPDDRARVVESTHHQAYQAYAEEYRIVRPDGSERWIRERAFPVVNAAGKIDRIAGQAEDITQSKQLEHALAEREGYLHTLIDSLPSQIAYWDKNQRNVFANKAYADWLGQTPEMLKDKQIKNLIDEQNYTQDLSNIEGALRGEPQQFECVMTMPDGTQRHSLVNYIPDRLHGEVQGFYALISDVSAIKATEEELRTSEDRLLRTQTLGRIGSWELNLHTGELWWSDESYRIFSLAPNMKVSYELFLSLVHPDDREGLIFAWEDALQHRATHSYEHRIVLPNGEIRFIWMFAEFSYDDGGKPFIVSGCYQDISERKRVAAEHELLHSQLMQAQKMESIGHLTGGIAHDFNNMLGAMLGYAELLKQITTTASVPPQRTQKYLNEILTAGNRAKELISQMLIFSRLNPESQSEDVPVILLQPVIKEVVHLLRSSIPSSIAINYHTPDERLRTRMHPVQLHQIVLNLAINARDAIDEYGNIDVTLVCGHRQGKCDSCHQDFEGEYIDLSVQDTGHGIAPELLSKIFDPFFTTKDVGKGTGMGLSVVHGIVHAVGGHLTISSQAGHGTLIRILLPLATTRDADKPPLMLPGDQQQAHGKLAGARVMVVDDEQSMVSMLHELLQLHGAQVTTFTRPTDALTTFQRHTDDFDIVITDETMPELSGLDMAVTMLQKRPLLPIILCTGYSERVNADVVQQYGIAGFMNKPLDLDGLIDMTRNLVSDKLPPALN